MVFPTNRTAPRVIRRPEKELKAHKTQENRINLIPITHKPHKMQVGSMQVDF